MLYLPLDLQMLTKFKTIKFAACHGLVPAQSLRFQYIPAASCSAPAAILLHKSFIISGESAPNVNNMQEFLILGFLVRFYESGSTSTVNYNFILSC